MELLFNMPEYVGLGLATALTPTNLLYCFIGVTAGMAIGVIPGVGGLTAISILFPITFYLDTTSALIMLGGIYYGSAYGGAVSSILLNVPGDTSSAVVCIDGNPMAKQGRAGVALLGSAIGSFIGGSTSILLMMFFSPLIATVALTFGAAEYFALMLLGLVAATTVSSGSAIKGLISVLLGITFGLVGMDLYMGASRFSFGSASLIEGVSLVALAMGLFGITEIIEGARQAHLNKIPSNAITLRSMIPTRDDISRSWRAILRGTGVGAFCGPMPGMGSVLASFMAYSVEKKVAKDPSRFGKGAIEGVVAPEAANNAADQGAFIPTLALGIPGSATMALILGVLLIYGITPGPQFMTQKPEMFWGLIMSFWVGNLMLLVLNIPLIGIWVRMLAIPYHYMYPAILMFICLAVYSINNNVADIWVLIMFGVLGYFMRIFDYPKAPLMLGFVLGPMMEGYFRRAMVLSRGDFATFIERPISATIMAIVLALLLLGIWGSFSASYRLQKRQKLGLADQAEN